MKKIKSKSGEEELQPGEYVPDGPVALAPNAPDSRRLLNSDGSKSSSNPDRPVYVHPDELLRRVVKLEAQVLALQAR